MECKQCKKSIQTHSGCSVMDCMMCSRCEKCDIRLCRNCDDRSNYLNWYEHNGVENEDVYWCEKCVKKHKKKHLTTA
jgi:hypothetical protein